VGLVNDENKNRRGENMNETYETRTLIYPDELHETITQWLYELIHRSMFIDDDGSSYFGMFEQSDSHGKSSTVLKDRDYMTAPEIKAVVKRLLRERDDSFRKADWLEARAEMKEKVLEADVLEEEPLKTFTCRGVAIDPEVVKKLRGGTIEELTDIAIADPSVLKALKLSGESRAMIRRTIYRIVTNAVDDDGMPWFWMVPRE
jgi:hypothetical protein